MESFKGTVPVNEVGAAAAEMSGVPTAELHEMPVHGQVLREEVAALETAAHEGATLWICEGRWPNWEGIAAVRNCEVVAPATLVNH